MKRIKDQKFYQFAKFCLIFYQVPLFHISYAAPLKRLHELIETK